MTEDTTALASDIDAEAVDELQEQASQRQTTLIARASPETAARVGSVTEIHVNAHKLYFFAPESGASIVGEREAVSIVADTP